MCILCVQIDKDLMTPLEIARALTEVSEEDPHADDIMLKLLEHDLVEEVTAEYFKLEENK